MEKYDFLLFENQQNAINHYKDVCIIAKMLKSAGFSVAIATLYEEDKYCNIPDIPLIKIGHTKCIPNNDWQYHPKNKLHSLLSTLIYLFQQHYYIKEFLKNIRGLAKNYYAGSYDGFTSSLFIKEANPDRSIFFWGVRTYRISNFKAVFKINQIWGLRLLYMRSMILKNKYLCFFVSNEIIKKEHISIGLQSNRLVIREERVCDKLPERNYGQKSNNFTLLSIGLLRPSKGIELLIQAFKEFAGKDERYIIAGRTSVKYASLINSKIDKDERIIRIDGFINEELFQTLFINCHFLLINDNKEASSITNGTMLEAFLNRRPIIAPNYEPYSYYVNTYNLGLLYDEKSVLSLINTIIKAKSLPIDFFEDNFDVFLESLVFSKKVQKMKQEINLILAKN